MIGLVPLDSEFVNVMRIMSLLNLTKSQELKINLREADLSF